MRIGDTMRRLRAALWTGSTTEVEIVLGLALGFRATWMLWPTWQSIPVAVQGYFIPPGMTETQYGLVLLLCASTQVVVAVYRGPMTRAVVAGLLTLFQGSIAAAYWQAGDFYRAVVPLILVIVLAEWWVSWRAWTDKLVKPNGERRGNGHG